MTGMCQCESNDVKINEAPTGKTVGGKPEWKVTLSTDCFCVQTNVKLSCAGFQTVENLDPSIVTKDGDTCNLINPVNSDQPTVFTYAWDTSFGFKLISSGVACS